MFPANQMKFSTVHISATRLSDYEDFFFFVSMKEDEIVYIVWNTIITIVAFDVC